VKRHKNLRLLSRDQDKEALRNAPIIIAAKAYPHIPVFPRRTGLGPHPDPAIYIYADPKPFFFNYTGSERF
jgi:hypothetical protein